MSLTKNLIEALKNDNLENAAIFLEQGADPNYVFPSDGVAPIHLAAGLGKKALSLFIEHGGNPNVPSREGSTPLHVAATWGDDECVKLLLQCGADPNIKDQDGYQPVDVAKVYGHEEVYVYLKYYSLLLLSDDQDVSDKYIRRCIGEDDKSITRDESQFDSSYDSDEASQLFDDCMTSRNFNNLYINKLNHQLHHHTRCGQQVSIDVTSPDHPYMDYKQPYRQTNLLSPGSSKGNNSLEDTFILDNGTSALNNLHHSSNNITDKRNPHHFLGEPSSKQNHSINRKYLMTSSVNNIQQEEETLRQGTSPLPEFQKNFKQNNTLQWVSQHADVYTTSKNGDLVETNDKLKSHSNSSMAVVESCHHQHPQRSQAQCSDNHHQPHLSFRKIQNCPCCCSKIKFCGEQSAYHSKLQHSFPNQSRRHIQHEYLSSSINSNSVVQEHIKCPAEKPFDSVLSTPLQNSESESDSTLSQNSQKSSNSQYSKRKFVKSRDNHVVPRRCRDQRDQFNWLSQINDTHGPDTVGHSSFNYEACIDPDTSSNTSQHMISDCVPIHSESRNISTLSDIVSHNRAAYTDRISENKRKWPNQQSMLYSGEAPFSSKNDNINNSYISDDSNQTNILNTAQLSTTLPFELNSSQSSKSISGNSISNTRRESDSSCDTFVTCEDGDPNRTISDEQINMLSQSTRALPQASISDDSRLYSSDQRFTETSKPKWTKMRNVGDLSDRLQSFKINSPKRGTRRNDVAEVMALDEKLVKGGANNRKQSEPSSEPSLISVSTPNDKNISPSNSRKLSIASSILDKGFCGDRRPSLDSMFSNITVKEYVYRDAERGITLIERHVPSECGNSTTGRLSLDSVTSARSIDSQKTEEYDWKSYVKTKSEESETDSDVQTVKLSQQLSSMSNDEIRQRLLEYGEDPGPVIAATRQTYLIRLASVTSNPGLVQLSKHGPDYSIELRNAMEGKFDDVGLQDLDIKMMDLFNNSNGRKWREGSFKSSFNYLLLDPRVTKNLPLRVKNMADGDVFCTFIAAIFYIGKGKRSRPYTHLYEAITHLQKPKPTVSTKVQQILDIWSEQQGVVSLHIFQNVIPVEAYTREACMIQAFGLDKLTNKKKGDFYGTSSTWSMKAKRRMGVYFLKKALQIFLAEGERQICPPDIKMGQ